ncbi:MAG: RsmB/NOP family class I SAM-dependent RNA methyltransferase [Burkholderiales bacterium]|jgi:16S rRNA (cytosine967-C5)-methyltransferase|nr:RsmB/NOP family class I SAM-dependent RNA methyltransferase [Burkholderiales bacterium]
MNTSTSWRPSHIKYLAEALNRVDTLRFPADDILRRFFREHPVLGQNDRALIAEGVFAFLRRRRSLKALAQTTRWQRLALLILVREFNITLDDALELAEKKDRDWLNDLPERLSFPLRAAEDADVPDALWARLGEEYEEARRLSLAQVWQKSAHFDLRVNTQKISRDEALRVLRNESFSVAPTPYSPYGLRVFGRPMLAKHTWLMNGYLEVQSESSQIAGLLVAPKRGEMIADFCAGAGGKTLLLGMLMRSQGRLYAFDISERRLRKLAPRLARSGLSNVHPQRLSHENDIKIKRLARKMDRVLVDAPCTGTGTLQRNPDLKWCYNEEGLRELNEKQLSILSSAARLVKPQGRLVYATCSVLRAENEIIAERFLETHRDFCLCSADTLLADAKVPLDTGAYLKIFPDTHETDGFFAATFVRN